ncbi:hypothetical protein ACLKA7_000972 [Drosophila subpalustris]
MLGFMMEIQETVRSMRQVVPATAKQLPPAQKAAPKYVNNWMDSRALEAQQRQLDTHFLNRDLIKVIKVNIKDSISRVIYPMYITSLEMLRDECHDAEKVAQEDDEGTPEPGVIESPESLGSDLDARSSSSGGVRPKFCSWIAPEHQVRPVGAILRPPPRARRPECGSKSQAQSHPLPKTLGGRSQEREPELTKLAFLGGLNAVQTRPPGPIRGQKAEQTKILSTNRI